MWVLGVLRVNVGMVSSSVVVETPVRSAAYLNAPKASVVVPILLAVLDNESVDLSEETVIAVKAAVTAVPIRAAFLEIVVSDPPTLVRVDCKPLNAFLVLSSAFIVILTFSAIAIARYFEIRQPFVKMIDRHLFCFCNGKV